MKRFIYILFFAVAFSAFCAIRAEAVTNSPPSPSDYISDDDSDSEKEEGFSRWLNDYSAFVYINSDKLDPKELVNDFNSYCEDFADCVGATYGRTTQETITNIKSTNTYIGDTLDNFFGVLNEVVSKSYNWGDNQVNGGSGSGSSVSGGGFRPNDGAPSGGTSFPLSNGGRIVVNDFKIPQAPHSVDLYDDSQENNYCLLELLSYDKFGNVIDKRYICTSASLASDTYALSSFSFTGGIYEFNGRFYINYQYPYHNANINPNADGGGQIKVDVSATGGANPADLPSIDPNGSLYYYPESGWIDGRACLIGQDDDGNSCIMFSDDGSIYYPNKDGSFSIGGDTYYINLNYSTINDNHKSDIADALRSGAVYLTLLANSGSANGQDYSVILQYIADRLDENNSILTLMASDDFLSHILSLLGLAAGFMDENQITEFIPLLLSLSNKIVALLPYDCISSAMADIENTLFSGSPINDIYVWINGERYVLISASFAASCQVGVDIVKTLCALVIVYMWLINMRKKVVTF